MEWSDSDDNGLWGSETEDEQSDGESDDGVERIRNRARDEQQWYPTWRWYDDVLAEDVTLLESDDELDGSKPAQLLNEVAKELRLATLDDDQNKALGYNGQWIEPWRRPVEHSEENIDKKTRELSTKRSTERQKELRNALSASLSNLLRAVEGLDDDLRQRIADLGSVFETSESDDEELWSRAQDIAMELQANGMKDPIATLLEMAEAGPARAEMRLRRYTQFVRGLRWNGPKCGYMEARYVGHKTRSKFRASLDWSTFKWSLAREDELIEFEDIVDWNAVEWRWISTASALEKLFHHCPESTRCDVIERVCAPSIGHYRWDHGNPWHSLSIEYVGKPREKFSPEFLQRHWQLFKFHRLVQQKCPTNLLFDSLAASIELRKPLGRWDWKYVSANMVLTDNFIRQHANELDWAAICRFQDASHELLMEFRSKVVKVIDDLYLSSYIKYESVLEFFPMLRGRRRYDRGFGNGRPPTEKIARVIKEGHRQIVIRDLSSRAPLVMVDRIMQFL